jgi:dsRNA-specific ribonuclease
MTRSVDMEQHLHLCIDKPRAVLLRITEKLGKPRPVARILKETGRRSPNPVFIVGIFIGPEKISEGYGNSLSMAEIRVSSTFIDDLGNA